MNKIYLEHASNEAGAGYYDPGEAMVLLHSSDGGWSVAVPPDPDTTAAGQVLPPMVELVNEHSPAGSGMYERDIALVLLDQGAGWRLAGDPPTGLAAKPASPPKPAAASATSTDSAATEGKN